MKAIGLNKKVYLKRLSLHIGYNNFKTNINKNRVFKRFEQTNIYTIQNIKLWCKLNKKPFELLSTEYKRACIKLKWKCLNKDCGKEFESRWNDIHGGQGCGHCRESKGEKECKNFLNKNNYEYIPQKEFEGLIGLKGGNLSYDFYLPKYNLLIEYQGEFHDGSSGEYSKINLKSQQEHDKRKKEYAEANGYNFLEIWYWDFDNIEEILDEYLNKLEQ